ncbi:Eco57I restriction-modification methylase domain-containing protein [Actinoplanes sp. CA-142083]|uniref:Eco57I restriction-modification methylase domain-containing protein n=1 Tax=Actinoplanes sp. CA-142083 TaxID=3239903 RepID=UPI003D8F6581
MRQRATEGLVAQARKAVASLAGAFGRPPGVEAHEIYRGAVVVMMRVVFLRFAERQRLLLSYGTSRVSTWRELTAVFDAVHRDHGGSLFEPAGLPWLPAEVPAEVVAQLLRVGDLGEIEEIGYVYEGLLSFEGYRADDGSTRVARSGLRRNTGTHYTPRELADEIVDHALAPLIYDPGPLQTPDPARWRLRPAEEILALRVADIAMGSGAFLLAAARCLGRHVPSSRVVERCLYGADINPMAVEMAKLSLWLAAADERRPFTFLDDHLIAGDSLLGITCLAELAGSPTVLADKHAAEKHADLVTAAALARLRPADIRGRPADVRLLPADRWGRPADIRRSAVDAGRGSARDAGGKADVRGEQGSAGPEPADVRGERDSRAGGLERRPVHWPLVFPEVFANGGFDAIVGNPPFLGGKRISGAHGPAYRKYLVDVVGRGVKGNADLIAYFALRAHSLLNATGQTGLIGTNTLAQGDTREVGLDQLVARGVTITRAVKSRRWPSRSAALEYCVAWTSKVRPAAGIPVITSSLEAASRVHGTPKRLRGSAGIAYIGNFVNGIGFVLSDDERDALLAAEPQSSEVVHRYLNGRDVNRHPEQAASRWIIDFHGWPLERAAAYPACLARVERLVKPARDALPDAKRSTREKWWQYEKLAPGLRGAIADLKRVIAITLVGKSVMPAMVPTGQVFSHMLGVFATDDPAMLALLSSSHHYWWAARRASTLGTTLRYTPSDAFETFPLPFLTSRLRELGDRLDLERRDVMLTRGAGLTATYNRVFDPRCGDADVAGLRELHREIDFAVADAYGWSDLPLDHGFHEGRYTVGPAARQEILDRLLELNQAR